MLIDEFGTIRLRGITLNREMSSNVFLSKYHDLFRGTLMKDNSVGVFRSRAPMRDEQGNYFRVTVDIVAGSLFRVFLLPLLETSNSNKFRDLRKEEEKRRDFCNRILQEAFGTPTTSDLSQNAYTLNGCTVTAWSSIDPRDMCSGGCITVLYALQTPNNQKKG